MDRLSIYKQDVTYLLKCLPYCTLFGSRIFVILQPNRVSYIQNTYNEPQGKTNQKPLRLHTSDKLIQHWNGIVRSNEVCKKSGTHLATKHAPEEPLQYHSFFLFSTLQLLYVTKKLKKHNLFLSNFIRPLHTT
jgi:hypothetical protein